MNTEENQQNNSTTIKQTMSEERLISHADTGRDRTAKLNQQLLSRQSLFVLLILFFAYLIVYGVFMESREWYLNVDEIRDFSGGRGAYELYLCNGRWGLALYRLVFPGLAPLNGVFIAGVWLCFALVLQGSLLGLKDVFSRSIYGVVVLCVPLLGEHLLFANQADAVCMAVFMSTVAVWLNVMKSCVSARLVAVILLVFSFSIYQSLILNAAILYLGILYLRCMRKESIDFLRYCRMTLPVMICASVIYGVVAYTVALLPFLDPSIKDHVAEYQRSRFSLSSYMNGDVVYVLRLVCHNVFKLFKLMIGVSLPLLFCSASIFLIIGWIKVWRMGGLTLGKRIWLSLLPVAILGTPFLICVLMNASAVDAASVRTYTAAPFACAVLWVGVMPRGGERRPWCCGMSWSLLFFVLAAAYENNAKIKGAREFYSSFIRDYILIEYEAAKINVAHGGSSQPRVLLFGAEYITPFDDICNHPYVRNVHLPTDSEKEVFSERVQKLPCWPDCNSVQSMGENIVVVKYR